MPDREERCGVLHVHTRYSDGGDPVAKLVRISREVGLDYLIITDHDGLKARARGWEGWHDGVLVVVGLEVSGRHNHIVALNVDRRPKRFRRSPGEILADIRRQGGLAFAAHPEGKATPPLHIRGGVWTAGADPNLVGLEVWSLMEDWAREVTMLNLLEAVRHPERFITGPSLATLRRWDAWGLRPDPGRSRQPRRIVGIGGLDAHGLWVPFPILRFGFFQVLPAAFVFRTIRTHVLTEPWTGQADADRARLYEALQAGRCSFSYDLLADATGFRFWAERDARIDMGEEVVMGVPPEAVVLEPLSRQDTLTSALNRLHGPIARITPVGALARVVVDCGFPLVSLITRESVLNLALSPGVRVLASFKATGVHVIRRSRPGAGVATPT